MDFWGMKIRELAPDKLKPYPGNPRIIDKAISRVAESIRQFGFNQPIVVDKDMVVVVGHTRLEAAKSLGLEKVPVIVAEHLTEEQARAYRLRDNKSAEYSVWDNQKLFEELSALSELGQLDITGFSDSEMLALEMEARALLEATVQSTATQSQATSLAGQPSAPPPDQSEGNAPADELEGDFGPANDHDNLNDDPADDAPQAPAMVRFEAILDEEQRRAVVTVLNQAKTKHGLETMGQALHLVALHWMEGNR